jgi:hypothetical protein
VLCIKRRADGLCFVGNLNNLYSNTLYNEGIINIGGYTMVLELGCCFSLTMESFSCVQLSKTTEIMYWGAEVRLLNLLEFFLKDIYC